MNKLWILLMLLFSSSFLIAQTKIGNDIDGEAASDKSGSAVALSGDGKRVAIGANLNDVYDSANMMTLTNAGHVRIFNINSNGNTWVQVGADIEGLATEDQSGFQLALSELGDIVAIGAIKHDGTVSNAGLVQVFKFDGTTWNQLGNNLYGVGVGDNFGTSLDFSADGTQLIIGAPFHSNTGTRDGMVQVYEWDGSNWIQKGSTIFGELSDDRAGWDVAIADDGDRIAIGAPYNDSAGNKSGSTRIFDWNGTDWTLLGNAISGEAANDQSGFAIELSETGDKIVIGAPFNSEAAAAAGHVRIFEWNGSAWNQVGADIDGNTASNLIGWSIDMADNGNKLAFGAPLANYSKVYEWDGSNWIQTASINGEFSGDDAGWSVSLSTDGNALAIGAKENSNGGGASAGHTRVYSIQALAVELLKFEAYPRGKSIQLSWQTVNEFNNKGFQLEKSSDGIRWEILGFVAGQVHSSTLQEYQFIDENPFVQENYYRLKQIDLDGQFMYSDLIHLFWEKEASVIIYPNPVQDHLSVQFSEQNAATTIELSILNSLGQAVFQASYSEAIPKIDLSGFSPGNYVLRIEAETEVYSFPFFKLQK